MSAHVFSADLTWNAGGLPFTYPEYSRFYSVRIVGKPDLLGTSAPAFVGSPYHHNPEDLLIASLSACHLLTYLAVACKSKITVVAYSDHAEGQLENVGGGKFKFTRVTLRPQVVIAAGQDVKKAESLHTKAHDACFIANSVNFEVAVDPSTRCQL